MAHRSRRWRLGLRLARKAEGGGPKGREGCSGVGLALIDDRCGIEAMAATRQRGGCAGLRLVAQRGGQISSSSVASILTAAA